MNPIKDLMSFEQGRKAAYRDMIDMCSIVSEAFVLGDDPLPSMRPKPNVADLILKICEKRLLEMGAFLGAETEAPL